MLCRDIFCFTPAKISHINKRQINRTDDPETQKTQGTRNRINRTDDSETQTTQGTRNRMKTNKPKKKQKKKKSATQKIRKDELHGPHHIARAGAMVLVFITNAN